MKFSFSKSALFSAITILAFSVGALTACQTPTGTPETPAQLAAQICPPVQAGLTTLLALPELTVSEKATLTTKIQPAITLACSAGSTISVANLQSLANTSFPVVLSVIQQSSLSTQDKNNAIVGLTAIQVLVDAVIAADPQANVVIVPTAAAASVPVPPTATTTPAVSK